MLSSKQLLPVFHGLYLLSHLTGSPCPDGAFLSHITLPLWASGASPSTNEMWCVLGQLQVYGLSWSSDRTGPFVPLQSYSSLNVKTKSAVSKAQPKETKGSKQVFGTSVIQAACIGIHFPYELLEYWLREPILRLPWLVQQKPWAHSGALPGGGLGSVLQL